MRKLAHLTQARREARIGKADADKYRSLLMRYTYHVWRNTGRDFLSPFDKDPAPSLFTEEEWRELQAIADQGMGDCYSA